jgi:HK97 family phage portal protein
VRFPSIFTTIDNSTPIGYTAVNTTDGTYNSKPEYRIQMETYAANSTLHSVVSFLSSTTSQVGWKLYRKAASGNKEDRVEVMVHPALSILNKPTQFSTRQDLFEASQQHVELAGESYWVLERSAGGIVKGIWLARPDRMTVVKSKTEFLLGYQYLNPDGSMRPLEKEDVMQIKTPDPVDPYRGISPVAALMGTIDSESYAEHFQKNFFRNGAKPGGVIRTNVSMGDEQWKKMIARWREQHQGVENANRIAFMEQGEFIDLKYTHDDMQFFELRQFSAEQIMQAFGLSKAMLGVVDDVNRANNEAQDASFAKYKLKPRLERFKEALNNEYLPQFAQMGLTSGYEFDYDDIDVEDTDRVASERDYNLKAVETLIGLGFDPVATLEAYGFPAIPMAKPTVKEVPDAPVL